MTAIATTATPGGAPLRHPMEMPTFCACLAFSAAVFGLVAAGLVALALAEPLALIGLAIIIGVIWLMDLLAHAFVVCHVRGNGLLVSEHQLPRVHEAARRAAAALGVAAPEVYVIQFGKVREAMVKLFLGSKIVVLSSALVHDCRDGPELEMAVGREVGHLRFHHRQWNFWLFPSMILPLLFPAWRRATEYTADRCGMAVCGDWRAARRMLLILAAGGDLGRKVSPDVHARQVAGPAGFWLSLKHLFSHVPCVTWRVSELLRAVPSAEVAAPVPSKNFVAVILAALVPGAVTEIRPVHGVGGMLVMIMVVGIVIALLIPAASSAIQMARNEAMTADLHNMIVATHAYAASNKDCLPPSLGALEEHGLPKSVLERAEEEDVQYVVESALGGVIAGAPGDERTPRLSEFHTSTTILFFVDRDTHVLAAFADGHVMRLSQDDFERVLEVSIRDIQEHAKR